MRNRVCCRKAILALLDQLTRFGQRESLTIHVSSGSGQMSAVSSAQSVKMLQYIILRDLILRFNSFNNTFKQRVYFKVHSLGSIQTNFQ